MSLSTPDKEWWSTDELAAQRLPDLPGTRRGVEAFAQREDWRADPVFARKRSGRGGGWEYHWTLLPVRAQAVLLRPVAEEQTKAAPMPREEAWAAYEDLTEASKTKARDRLDVVRRIEQLTGPMGRNLAVQAVAKEKGVSARTLWNWLSMIESTSPEDWLAYLAPRRAGAGGAPKARCTSDFWDMVKADYLRLEAPEFSASYDRACKIAKARGWSILTKRTAERRMKAEVPRVVQVFAREGERGLERCFPPQRRDRSTLQALQGVNADCHKFDVFVLWPGVDKPVRVQLVAFQDLYSGKILAWRYDRDPNKVAVMSAFGEMVETWGIPRHVTFDNGMEFANYWLTGGTKTRFRFKVRDDNPLGVLPQLGIDVHWATPGHGQAKPVERAFRDMAQRIAKDPRFAGAYVGNRPDAKPENYMSRAIPLEEFVRICDEGITEHNAREGRLSDTARGRSFDETFAESYANVPVRKATAEQRRLWLMGQEVRKLSAQSGQFKLLGGEYWSDWMVEHAGEKVIGRFDPEDLHAGLYIYALDGSFLGFAEPKIKTAFYDYASAKVHARRKSSWKKAQRQALREARPLDVQDVAQALDDTPTPEGAPIETKVVMMAQMAQRAKGPLVNRPVPQVQESPEEAARREAVMLSFKAPKAEAQETPEDRYRRACEIEARSEAGKPVGQSEADWLLRYRETPEYRTRKEMAEDFQFFGPSARD